MQVLVLIGALIMAGSLSAADPEKKAAEIMPLPLPIEVMDGKELDLGIIYNNELRTFQFMLKNTSNRPLEYNQVVVSCSCSMLQLPVPGSIAPDELFVVPIELDARKISEKGAFKKSIRIDFPGYQSLELIFTGQMSSEIQILIGVGDEERLAQSVPVTFIESVYENWERTLVINAEFTDSRKLEFGDAKMADPSAHHCQLIRLADNHWILKVLPALPQKLGLITNEVILPMLAPNSGSTLRISLEGMVGSRIEASLDELYWDPKTDPEQTKKTFALTRLPFNDRVLRVAMLLGRPNPYAEVIKVLTPSEVNLPHVPGITFELEQGSGGVFVHCYMQGNKIPTEGIDSEFKVEGSKGCSVRFGVMDEAKRKALEEREKEDADEEE